MEQFRELLRKHYRERPGPYIRELIEKDMGGLSIGTPNSAFDSRRIGEFLAAETALFRLELLARTWVFADGDKRSAIAQQIIDHILDATRRRNPAEYPEYQDAAPMLAAEEKKDPLPALEKGKRPRSA